MAIKEGLLRDSSGNIIYPNAYTHNIYNEKNESLTNILAKKVNFKESTLSPDNAINPLENYYDKNTIDNFNVNKANKNLDNINPTLEYISGIANIHGKSGTLRKGAHVCIESWVADDDSQWYRLYSDGWKEMGGIISSVTTDSQFTYQLPTKFAFTDYIFIMQAMGAKRNSTQYTNGQSVVVREFDTVTLRTDDYAFGRMWYACGY